jgi:hypothetical protein
MLAGFFPPMENLIPLTVVGTQSLPASTGPAGVLKYGETPFSLKLMPNPGPNLILPLISAIVLLGLIGRAVLLDPAYLAASRWHPTWRPSSSPSCCAACPSCHFGRFSSSLEGVELLPRQFLFHSRKYIFIINGDGHVALVAVNVCLALRSPVDKVVIDPAAGFGTISGFPRRGTRVR